MREKLELRAQTWAVIVTACWPVALGALGLLVLTLLFLPWQMSLGLTGGMLVMGALVMAWCIPGYLGWYEFIPATAYKGARLVAHLGRTDYEVSGVSAADVIVKSGWIERLFHVCHIRVKGTMMYYRGVPEMEKVRSWIDANFPKKSLNAVREEEKKQAEERAKAKKKAKMAKKR